MHRFVLVTALVVFALTLGATHAEAVNGPIYGFSFQWSRDADGDGIPNHLDEDWVRPENGTGYQMKHGSFPLTTCASYGTDQSRQAFRYSWQHQIKDPGAEGDQIRNRNQNRNQSNDGAGDQVHLRTRERACK